MNRIVAIVAGIAACAGPGADFGTDDPDRDPVPVSGCEVGPEPRIRVGKGEREFEQSYTDDCQSVLIHGLQGGFHTFVSVRGAHLSLEERWQLDIEGWVDDEVWARASLERTPLCNPEVDQAEANGTWLIWVRRRPEDLHDREITIRVRAEDADGRVVEAETEQIIWDPALAE